MGVSYEFERVGAMPKEARRGHQTLLEQALVPLGEQCPFLAAEPSLRPFANSFLSFYGHVQFLYTHIYNDV